MGLYSNESGVLTPIAGRGDLTAIRSEMSYLGAKNLLPSIKTSKTVGNVTFTLNGDGSITANGTASSTIYVDLVTSQSFLGQGNYVLSGGVNANQFIYVNTLNSGTYVDTIARAEGEDAVFSINYSGYNQLTVGISIASGQSVDYVTFYPMIRLASDPDNTYVPYAKTNKHLTDDSVDWYSNGIIGAKNLIPFPYPKESDTVLGIDFTANSNGEVIASGTSTGIAVYDVVNTELYGWNVPREGTYILSDGLSYADYEYAYTAVTFMYNDGTIEYNVGDTSIGRTVITIPSNLKNFYVGCCIRIDKTVSNIKFKPMLRMIEDSDETFRLYAKTNRELTVDKAEITQISNPNLLDNPWFTVNQRGITTDTQTEGTARYTLDRWKARGIPTVKVNSDGSVTFDNTTGTEAHTIMNLIEPSVYNKFKGRTVTISVDAVCTGTGSFCGVYQAQQSPNYQRAFYFSTTRKIYSKTLTLGSNTATGNLEYNLDVVAGESLTVYACKLELGSVSTLAMDTAPNYATELLKCQRYFFKVSKDGVNTSSWVGIALANGNATCGFPAFPVTMRAKPTVSNTTAHSFDSKTAMTVTNVYADTYGIQGVVLTDSVTGRGYSIAFEASADL